MGVVGIAKTSVDESRVIVGSHTIEEIKSCFGAFHGFFFGTVKLFVR